MIAEKKRHLSTTATIILLVLTIKLIIKAKILLSACIFASKVGLFPDEAQYWTWSQALSYGYYSKPLGIAYQIATGCLLFGNSELGVRFISFFFSCGLSIAIYFLAKRAALPDKMALLASLAFTLTPLAFASTFLATTDCAMLLFWTLASTVVVGDLMEGRQFRFPLIGLFIGLGALFKWTILILWLPILAYAIYHKRISLKQLSIGLLLTAVMLAPSIAWNINHEYAGIRHVFRSIFVNNDELVKSTPNPLSFLGAQFGLISPILMALILVALAKLTPLFKKLPPSISFCYTVTILSLLSVFALSCGKKVQANWAVFAYPTSFICLIAFVNMQQKLLLKWLYGAIIFSCALLLSFSSLPVIERYYPEFGIPYRLNPFKEGLGWDNLEQGLTKIGYNPDTDFLFSDRYQTTSILSFYGPQQKRAYFFNLRGVRKNQFSYWPSMAEEKTHKNGFYVGVVEGKDCLTKAFAIQQSTRLLLKDYFTTLAPTVILIPLVELQGQLVKVAYAIRCEDYNGTTPSEGTKY